LRLNFYPCILSLVRRTKRNSVESDALQGAAPGSPPGEGAAPNAAKNTAGEEIKSKEVGGPEGPEPTRYGDWERNGRCVDF
jgi:hypothetical protein